MRRSVVALAALCLLGEAGQATAETAPLPPRRPSLPLAGVITRPEWLAKPSGDDVAKRYPLLAQDVGLSGQAVIQCTVNAAGLLEECKVNTEEPAGLGFGAASVALSASFRMKPQTLDGQSVGGGVVRIPVIFRVIPDPPSTFAAPPLPPGNISPSALALSRRLVTALGVERSLRTFQANRLALVERVSTPAAGFDPAVLETVMSTYKPMTEELRKRVIDWTVDALPRLILEPQLAQIVAFYESDAGKAWNTAQPLFQTISRSAYQQASQAVLKESQAAVCKKIKCPDIAAPAPPDAAAALELTFQRGSGR